jgi:hypothetical protein
MKKKKYMKTYSLVINENNKIVLKNITLIKI